MRYFVIGGQYQSYCYGVTESLHNAKCLATRCEEYWDNWQGWHKPAIFADYQVDEAPDMWASKPNLHGVWEGPYCSWNGERWVINNVEVY